MVLIIDNYDSFSYNLYQVTGQLCPDTRVIKNDEMTVDEIASLAPGHIIISPGPGRPADAGVCEGLVLRLMADTPILGVCLGHQAICEALGAAIVYAQKLMHGKQSAVHIASGSPLFKGLPPLIRAGRYHSLAARRDSLPEELLVIAEDADGEVMGVKHKKYDLYGLQFHPESILTPTGGRIIENFLAIGGGRA
ncbi:MAG: aminodeoxychorismate/anthranilate synthase component II [Acidaminococcales bacterium]|jgi:anthranilate synthase component 2|nr:aminodeoxychorismate/anthranilate synthase component II [Acidaminococcales bacterium]